MNTVRLYDEFKGTLTTDLDKEGTKQAIEEYDSIKSSGKKASLGDLPPVFGPVITKLPGFSVSLQRSK